MPQTFQVLRCYKCFVFQVHLTKKSNKWECKLCGEKQSLKRHYGVGIAKDCRKHVQKLNSMRGELDELKCGQMYKSLGGDIESDLEDEVIDLKPSPVVTEAKISKKSKWSNFVEEPEVLDEANKEPMCLGDAEVVLEIPKKRRKQFHNYSSSNNYIQPALAKSELTENTHCDINMDKDGITNTSEDHNKPKVLEYTKSMPESEAQNEIKEYSKSKVPVKNFIPPVINKNSKWAQFADDEEDVIPSSSINATEHDPMFSLCDDSDLDKLLDI